jgi:alanyl aminopeptidase
MRPNIVALMALAVLALAACGDSSKPKEAVEAEATPTGQLGPDVTPTAYRLDLHIRPDAARFGGAVEIDVRLAKPKDAIFLHAKGLSVSRVLAKNGVGQETPGDLKQVTDSGVAKISFKQTLPAGDMTLVIAYDAPFSNSPDTLWKAEEAGEFYAATQFEALGARKAFPSFDEPRFKTPFEIKIAARKTDAVVSNAAIATQEASGADEKIVRFKPTKPLPTYLIAMFVGPYDVVEEASVPPSKLRPEPIPLRGLTVKGKGERIRYALHNTAALMAYLEDYFGVAYPYGKLDIITPPNFSAGGMENAAAIAYAERIVLLDENSSADQKSRFFLVHAHELAHQWFGDLVTPVWWDDIWLNESFASWMESKAAEAVRPGYGYDRNTIRSALKVMDLDSLNSARSIRQPIKTDGDIYNAFDGLTYDKGAAVLAMFEGFMGPENFQKGIQLHMTRYAHGVATAKDFLKSLSEGGGKPEIAAAFETFLTQSGVPVIRTKIECKAGGVGVGEIAQSAYAPLGAAADARRWSVPLCLRNAGKGEAKQCVLIQGAAAETAMIDVCPNPAILMNAGGAGYYRFDVGAAGWPALSDALGKMTPSEHLALLDSARASFMADAIDAGTYWTMLERLALSDAYDVVRAVADDFGELRDKLVSAPALPAFERKLQTIYAGAIAQVAAKPKGETENAALRRGELALAAVKHLRDAKTLTALAALASPALGPIAGKNNGAGVEPDLLPAALWAAFQEGGEAGLGLAIKTMTASDNGEFRNQVILAMASARHPAAMKEVFGFALSGAIRMRERTNLLRAMFDEADMRSAAWDWLKLNFDEMAGKLSEGGRSLLFRLPEGFCTPESRADIETFLKPKVDKYAGAPRVYANTLEKIGRCIALREAKSAEIEKLLAQAAPAPIPAAVKPTIRTKKKRR